MKGAKMKMIIYTFILVLLAITVLASHDYAVVMNVRRSIYHNPDCMWAKKCTKNCIKNNQEQGYSSRCQTLSGLWWIVHHTNNSSKFSLINLEHGL